ncbi:MAG TPA: YjbH domain-containing protein [Rhizomicrobium sp.]|nr:YjbH domain-containing protein [Rhizomicrobium sp.]
MAAGCGCIITIAVISQPVLAQDQTSTLRNTFGEVGLLEMPSARMAPDGQLSLNLGALENQQRYNLAFQILPWMEGSFRYSHISDLGRKGQYYDRSFGLKVRLFQETRYTPDVSVGIRDIIGTGIYGSEYLVATKQLWDVDLSAGMGWGRLASTETFPNPLGLVFKSFNVRGSRGSQTGGTVNFGQLFHGPDVGIFGGAVWHTPIDNVDLIAEYSSDRYVTEARQGAFSPKNQFNFGISYKPFDFMRVTGSYLYGTTWGLTISLMADPTLPNYANLFGTAPMPFVQRTSDARRNAVAELVNDSNDVDTIATGPWVQLEDKNSSLRGRLSAELLETKSGYRDFEIDGRTLIVNVQGARTGMCAKYAHAAASESAGIDSVAVSDLNDPRGQIAICAVRAPAPHRQAGVVLASLNADDLSVADPAQAGPDAPADASPAPDTGPQMPVDTGAAERKIREDASAQGIRVEAVSITAHEAIIYFNNGTYYFEAEAIGRLTRVLSADAPANVEIFRFISTDVGMPEIETRIVRAPFERMMLLYGHTQELSSAITIAPAPKHNPVLDAQEENLFPNFSWSIAPDFRQSLFDPKKPIELQVAALATGTVQIAPGLSLGAVLDGNIWNDFDLTRRDNSLLPHVRSDFEQYLKHGEYGIAALDADYFTRLRPDLYAEVKAGYLESMFAGVGGQVLWRPVGERFAIGADVYQVWQRNFDRLFGFQNYNVLTGHVSVYYESPWYGLNFAVHAGRYLAKDYGATFEVTRRFSTGVEIGAFATFTNVPFSKFGEGSFDKGIIIRIPLEWTFPFATQSSYSLDLRPLTRDGGQRLLGDDSLYDETRRPSYGEISRHLDDIAYPQ